MRPGDISRGRQIISRFLTLAEERLDHLTELYETGRWQRYCTHDNFVENVRDTGTAVEAWKLLAPTETLPNNRNVSLAWLDYGPPLPPRRRLPPELEPPRLSARFYEADISLA